MAEPILRRPGEAEPMVGTHTRGLERKGTEAVLKGIGKNLETQQKSGQRQGYRPMRTSLRSSQLLEGHPLSAHQRRRLCPVFFPCSRRRPWHLLFPTLKYLFLAIC